MRMCRKILRGVPWYLTCLLQIKLSILWYICVKKIMLLYQNKRKLSVREMFSWITIIHIDVKIHRLKKTFVKFQKRGSSNGNICVLIQFWSKVYFLLHSSTKLSFLSTLLITSLTFLSSHCTTSGCFQQAWHRPMYKPISCLRAAVWLKKPIKQ